jgi:O-antigen ligase
VVSTYGTPLGLGEYLAVALPFILQFVTGSYKLFIRYAAGISVLFVLFIAKISGSRLGMVGCLLAILFALGIWAVLKWRREPGGLLAPAIALAYPAGFCFSVAAVALVGRLRHLVWGNGSEKYSDDGRAEQWAMGIPKILSHPQGYGIGMSTETLGYSRFGLATIDSYYLSILLEFGVIGFIIFYGMICAAIVYCAKTVLAAKFHDRELEFLTASAIALTNFLLIKSVFSQQDNHPIVFVILGLSVALIYRARRSNEAPCA